MTSPWIKIAVPVLLLAAASGPADGAILHVPAQYRTIQAAIHAAGNGDTVLVAPGAYRENIDFLGKAIVLRSSHGPQVTTIDGGRAGSVVAFTRAEGPKSVLRGFTITNGRAARGGGIHIANASPTIADNVITGNLAEDNSDPRTEVLGGGVYCFNSKATITGNAIRENRASKAVYGQVLVSGGGIHARNSSPMIAGNAISKNVADAGESHSSNGGGIAVIGAGGARIEGNTIEDNTASCGIGGAASGGGVHCEDTSPVLLANVVSGNAASGFVGSAGGIAIIRGAAATIAGNVVARNLSNGMGGNGGGLALISTPAAVVFTSNTVVFNVTGHPGPGGGGAGLWVEYASLKISNSIFWGNLGKGQIAGFFAGISVTYSDVQGGFSGPGNLDKDPLFVDAANRDYHLTWPSPCRDRGDRSSVPAGLTTDFEGDPRVAVADVDMGADEFFPHLYHMGRATPGGAVQVRLVGNPGQSAYWAVSATVLASPVAIPGLTGLLHLDPTHIVTGPLGQFPASGVIGFPCSFPSWFPRISIPTQALAGTRLTNLHIVDVE